MNRRRRSCSSRWRASAWRRAAARTTVRRRLSRSELAAKADAICKTGERDAEGIQAPADFEDPEAAFAVLREDRPAAPEADRFASRRSSPDDDAKADWDAFIAAQQRNNELLIAIRDKAKAKDRSAVDELRSFTQNQPAVLGGRGEGRLEGVRRDRLGRAAAARGRRRRRGAGGDVARSRRDVRARPGGRASERQDRERRRPRRSARIAPSASASRSSARAARTDRGAGLGEPRAAVRPELTAIDSPSGRVVPATNAITRPSFVTLGAEDDSGTASPAASASAASACRAPAARSTSR